MWTREDLKYQAKGVLRGSYWNAFLATFIVSIIVSFGQSIVSALSTYEQVMQLSDMQRIYNPSDLYFLASVFAMVITIFVSYSMSIGMSKYFIENASGDTDLKYIFNGFRERYLNGVGALFVTNLLIFLWSLLFIIPGIIKSYEYSMVQYILAEKPNTTGDEARRLSREMTDSNKWDIFVLDLSFIGWWILGSFACGIGIMFVTPYYYQTKTMLYLSLRKKGFKEEEKEEEIKMKEEYDYVTLDDQKF